MSAHEPIVDRSQGCHSSICPNNFIINLLVTNASSGKSGPSRANIKFSIDQSLSSTKDLDYQTSLKTIRPVYPECSH